MKNHSGETQPIKDIFTGSNFYRVPEYQRPFYWIEENFEDLIDDLMKADFNEEYFLGTVVFHSTDNEYDIVDGQQRITTIIILLACLRDLIVSDEWKENLQEIIMQKRNLLKGIPEKARVQVREVKLFLSLIIEKGGTSKPIEIDNSRPAPEKRYITAVNIFTEQLKTKDEDYLQKLSSFIINKVELISLYAKTFQHAFRLFTIVNDRGRQLRRIDVLKAKNLALISVDLKRNFIAKDWEEWEIALGEEVFENVLYLIRFIYIEQKPYTDLLEEYEKIIFKNKLIKEGEDFFDTVFKYAELYDEILSDNIYFKEHPNKNKIISLLHSMNIEFKSYEWKACLLKYVERFKSENIEKFLNKIELKYLEGWILGLNKDTRTSIWGKIISKINNAKNSNEIIAFNVFEIDESTVLAKLKEDLYGKSFCKYILIRLELLTTEFDKEHKFNPKSIEHVLPKDMPTTSDWSGWFTQEKHDHWLNKLPNLVLLSKSKNSSSRNFNFTEKQIKYLKPRVTDYPRSVKVTTYAEWTPQILEERQTEIANICLKSIFS